MAKYGACMSTTDVVLRRLVDMSSIWMHRRGRKSKTEYVVPTMHNIPIYVINSKFRSTFISAQRILGHESLANVW
jgi:hypothetical protein